METNESIEEKVVACGCKWCVFPQTTQWRIDSNYDPHWLAVWRLVLARRTVR